MSALAGSFKMAMSFGVTLLVLPVITAGWTMGHQCWLMGNVLVHTQAAKDTLS